MANIIEKAFDVSKNIVRTIFLGRPNLFTTSDLNRQIQAFKYQMDSIENRLGAESDMEISFDSTGSQTRCKVMKGTYFRVNGLNIPLPNPSDVFGVNANYGTECYFYVWGNFARKTYTNDPTHEIAGAKFSDGTSMPAADQLVLGDVHYAMTDDIGDITRGDNEFSFLIAKMNVLNISDKYIRLNYKKVGSSVMMDSVNTLEVIKQPEQDHEDDPLKVGDDFNTCMNKLISKDTLRKRDIYNLRSDFESSDITSRVLIDVTDDQSSGGRQQIGKFKVALEGRNLIFSMNCLKYKVGSWFNGDGSPKTIGSAPWPSELESVPSFKIVIHQEPILFYHETEGDTPVTNCYLDFGLYLSEPSGSSSRTLTLTMHIKNQYGLKGIDGSVVNLYNKELWISTAAHIVIKSLRLPSSADVIVRDISMLSE